MDFSDFVQKIVKLKTTVSNFLEKQVFVFFCVFVKYNISILTSKCVSFLVCIILGSCRRENKSIAFV